MPVIDAHQHFWNVDRLEYQWLARFEPIDHTFEPADLTPLLARAGVSHTVLVQALDDPRETDYLIELQGLHAFIAGVVGWVPLQDHRQLERDLEAKWSSNPLCGIRHLIHEEADEDWLVRPEVTTGLRILAAQDVPFDVVAVTPRHLQLVPHVADAIPELRLVIDHLAKPPLADGDLARWATDLREAAERPNVYAKISGLNTAARPSWTAADLSPAIDVALDAFGPERLMFGSDWPVADLAGTYQSVIDATRECISRLTTSEQAQIMGDTAAKFYGLAVDA